MRVFEDENDKTHMAKKLLMPILELIVLIVCSILGFNKRVFVVSKNQFLTMLNTSNHSSARNSVSDINVHTI